jgi:hypothetical protein
VISAARREYPIGLLAIVRVNNDRDFTFRLKAALRRFTTAAAPIHAVQESGAELWSRRSGF